MMAVPSFEVRKPLFRKLPTHVVKSYLIAFLRYSLCDNGICLLVFLLFTHLQSEVCVLVVGAIELNEKKMSTTTWKIVSGKNDQTANHFI